jgi:hypothetical protein
VEFKAPKRSLPQNDRMWAMLTDVATQLPWHGIKLSPDDWKLIFLDALKRELSAGSFRSPFASWRSRAAARTAFRIARAAATQSTHEPERFTSM